jgi:predicted nucleotidyltransferase
LATRHGASNVRVFGPAARGDDTPESDIDLLVDVTGTTTPWFPGSLTADLEEVPGKRVQVVIQRSLSGLIRDAVLREAVPL